MSTPSASRKKAGAGRPEGAANQHARASSTASPASARSTGGLAESSATGEYEELVAGLLPPQVRFAAGTFDFNQDLQSQQFVEHQAQNAQGSRMLASEWVPTLHALQRFALEGVGSGSASSFADRVLSAWLNLPPPTSQKSADVEKEGEAPKDEKNDAREVAERHLFSKCLQALEEDLAALAGDEGEGDARSTAAAEGGKSKTSTSRVLAQLQKARLFQRGGRLFTSLNADEDAIYTSSDDEVSAVAGDAKDASGLFPKEPSRHDASVLPLRHALRSLRRVQRRRMQAEHLLLQWQGSDGDLAGLQTVLSLWAKDGIYSVAAGVATEAERSAASGGVGGAGVTGDAANSRDWAHAAEELRRIARFREENKAPRRELREWRAAARSLFGDDASTAGLETALASFLPADRACSLSADVFTAAQALVDADERRLVLARLDKFRALRQQTRGGAQACHAKEVKKNLRELLQPPQCFLDHGNDALRCPDCAFWLLQMQQFQQMEQEGTSGLLLQPVSTGFVRFLLLLSRWPWVRGSCAPPRAFRRSLAAALKDIRVERFSVSWLASGKRAAAAGQEEGEDDGEKTQTKKLYVGHLGSMYTTVWGGAFSGRSTLTPEILFWLRQLGPFQPLRLAADLSPRSHERKAARAAIDQKRHSLLQGEDRSGLYYALPGFAESDVTLGGEGENKRKNEKTLSVSAYSASLLAGDGDGMQVHTDADSTESESEAQFRQALAAARKRQPGGCVSHSSAAASGRGRLPRLEKDAASGGRGASQDLDLAKGFAYLGGGFTHLNTSWSYVPPKRRLTFLPSAGLHADSCRAEKQDEESKGGKESRKRHSVALNQGDAEAGARSAKVDGDGTEDGACSGVASSAWVVENSSSDESVRAFISDDAVYRRRFRSWRKRQRKAGGRVPLLSRSVRAAESAAALGTGSGDSPVDDAWQGHILDEFLRRMGSGMSLSRYTQLANAAAAGASTLASTSRRKFGTRSRKRPLSAADASKFSPESLISSEQASAMHDLKHLQPRPVWGGTGASFAGSPESSVFSLVSEPKKICRLRRKPRVRAVEPAWDLQSPSASLNALERGRAANGGSSRAVDSKHAPEFPFGMVAKGVWGGSPGAHAGSSTLKGREVQLICVDESEVHKRLGKTKLYQQVLHGMEDKLMARREFYVVVDEQSRELRVVPAGRLVFFLTETPRQRQEQFLSRLFADLRRRSRGTFLQSLLTKRRNARNILLMNAMIWQNQLKHVNKARLCLLLGGYWRDAAFAAANGSLTEQQLLQDFLSVNGAWLSDLVEKSAGASGESSGNHQGSKQNSARRLIEAISRRWSVEDRSRRSATEEGSWQAFQRDTPAVKAAAASMHLPPAVLEKIDEAAEDAAVVARAAVTAADRRTKEIVKRNLLPGLLLRYIQRIFPLFVRVYLTARCTFALQRREEQSFTRRMRQVENTGAKGGGAAAASAAGGFSANVLRGQYDVFTAGVSSTSPMGDLEKAEAGTTMESRLKAMLPPFNASATSPVELFDVGNLLPLHLVQIAEEGSSSFSASPFVLLVKGGSRASQVDVVAMEESWGRFAVDYARHVGQERRNRQGEGNGGPLLSTLSVDDCARLTKVLRALVVLYSRQNKTFFGAKGLGNALRVYLGRASDDTAGPNFDVLPLPVSQWIARTFLQQDEQEQLFLSQEKKTKLLATVLWLCVASSSNWTFDFEGLLVHEWNGRYGGHFEGCASLIGLKRTGNDSKPREYRLELPCPLTTGKAIEASQRAQIVAPIHSLLGHDKKKRSTR